MQRTYTPRPLNVIGREIIELMIEQTPAGKPFNGPRGKWWQFTDEEREILLYCTDKDSPFMFETAGTVVPYILSHIQSLRGDKAKRLKAELKDHMSYGGPSAAESRLIQEFHNRREE